MKVMQLIALTSLVSISSLTLAQQPQLDVDASTTLETQALTAKTFYYPKRPNQYGQLDYIFITATNGTQFCQEEGYRNAIGGSILCGEDESSYVDYDWYAKTWKSKATGSKNQCYPLYRSITCQ